MTKFPGFRDSRRSRDSWRTASTLPAVSSALMPGSLFLDDKCWLEYQILSRYLATCSADTTVKVWSISSNYDFKQEKVLIGHQRWVWDCAFSADSAYLVTGHWD